MRPTDPLLGFHFQVEWNGSRIGFTEVSGLDLSVDYVAYREGSDKGITKIQLPLLAGHSPVVLKRGIVAGDNEFYEWFNTIGAGAVERRDLAVSLLNQEHSPSVVWKIRNAWPVRLVGPTLSGLAGAVAIEELHLAHEGIAVEHAG